MRLARTLASLRRRLATLLIAATFPFATASGALACACIAPSSPDLAVLSVGVAFRGRVVATEEVGSGPHAQQRAHFEVDRLWKGQLSPRTSVLARSVSSCGIRFRVGEDVTVFANRVDGFIMPDSCSMHLRRGAGPGLARLEEQLDTTDAAVRAAPGALAPLLDKANLLRRWRDHERALTLYQDILGLSPGSIEAHAGMGLSLIALRRPGEAIAHLDAAQTQLGPHTEIQRIGRLARIVAGQPWDGGSLDFREADISGLDWSGRSFPGVDFTGAYLERMRLERTRMLGASFERAWLYNVQFGRSDLAQARFDGAKLENVWLRDADLQHATFHDSQFAGEGMVAAVMMENANLRGARFVRAYGFPIVNGANMQQAWLEQVGLTAPQLLDGTNLTGATIIETRIEFATFRQARLDQARFSNVHIRLGSLLGTSVDGAVFRNVTFDMVGFSTGLDQNQTTPLRAADLRGARLIDVRIQRPRP